jgi:hypothetical protein
MGSCLDETDVAQTVISVRSLRRSTPMLALASPCLTFTCQLLVRALLPAVGSVAVAGVALHRRRFQLARKASTIGTLLALSVAFAAMFFIFALYWLPIGEPPRLRVSTE